MNTPEAIARKWADRIFSGARIRPDAAPLISTPDCILQAAAEMVRESGAVPQLENAINSETIWRKLEDDDRSRHGAELAYEGNYEPKELVESLTRLREITKHGETKP